MSATATKQDTTLTPAEFAIVRTMLDRETAIQIGDDQQYLIESRLGPLLRQNDLGSIAELVKAVDRGDRDVIALTVDAMTTNETLFFRDKHPFEAISDALIPGLLEGGRTEPITIWCAACSSGQEPYSLAMLISEKFPDLVSKEQVRIVGTDLSSSMIERCREGRYSQFEVNRGLPAPLLMRYFDQEKRHWRIKPEVKSMVSFQEHNLLASWRDLPRCDIVMIRNVLIYFTVEIKSQLLAKVRNEVLKPGGALLLGSSETTLNVDDTFKRESYGKSIIYRAP